MDNKLYKSLLLDCTLRDGGYINDWNFGKESIDEIINLIINSNVDIVELGFLKNEPYDENRTVFNSIDQISKLIYPKRKSLLYAAMIEVINPIPIEKLTSRDDPTIDIIRVIVWKRLLKEGFEYCKSIKNKGYMLCVQPARVDQYSHEEFVDMIRLFNEINPLAVYVVDSFGTQNRDSLIDYFNLANDNLRPDISLGYHGHNNMMQAFGVAQSFLELPFGRNVIIDASVYGMGRGAGNLNIELIAHYLNENYNKQYKIGPFLEIYERYLKKIYEKNHWGFSLPLFLSALHGCNPMYGTYYGFDLNIEPSKIDSILKNISSDDKIQFTKEKADRYLWTLENNYEKTRR
jgi:4-hydroxy 2-oxovalerate aldolase